MEQLIGQTLNRYKILNLLGEGGMGAVFKAHDVTLQRDVALKVMHPHLSRQPNFRQRFLQEARTAAQLDHPGIVQVHDFGQEKSLLYIVMEFIPGANLRQMLQEIKGQGKWILLEETIQLVRQVSLALDYAHRQGVLHRDIKPDNIMMKPEAGDELPYRPVLTDLGLARLLHGQRITQEGTSMGTPAYMSPEQALGQPTDARSDVYSLGILFYELATGRLPFPIKSLADAIHYHTEELPPPPHSVRPDLPANLSVAILKALEKNPGDRFPNAAALAEALEAVTLDVTEVAPPTAVETTSDTEAVSLFTQYQQSLLIPRGPSIMEEFPEAPSGLTQDRIQVLSRDKTTRTITISSASMTIGRVEDNDIMLDDPKASRHHTRIEFDGTIYRVVDLDSTNGTFLGTTKLLPGVPETWTPGVALRVGDNWLRLVRARATVGTSLTRSDGTVLDPSLLRASAGEGRVGVYVENAQLAVEPGSSTTTSVTLLNQGSVVDHFKVTLDGIPADWTPSPPPVTQLMPGEQRRVSLTIQPPRAPQSRAGRYPVSVRVKSQDAPDQVAEMKITLTVAAYSQFTSQLQPQKVRAGKAASLTVKNQGNSQETFNLSWKDRADELTFDPPQARLRVPEGGTASAEFRSAPRQRRWIGGGQSHPITAQVSSAAGVTQTHSGEVVSRALFPVWVPPLLIFLCVLFTGAAWLFYRNQVEQVNSATQAAIAERTAIVQVVEATHQAATETADFLKNVNQATLQAITATAVWMEEDDDRDGLTNRQELDLGTLPDDRDTDEDGLDDSEELSRGTDPLKADTDGDGLKDGDEVSTGIDPLNTDTDGDGIPDNEDEFPGKVPTDTPTFTPTHTSTTTTTPTPSASPTSTYTPTPTPSPSVVTIEFDKFPNGSSINTSLILSGNEFSDKGIFLSGAPESSYCGDATAAAIRVSSYGYSYNFLTSARPGNINACNGVPVEIRFTNPVRSVTLTFAGASATYKLKAYDSADNLLGTADKDAVSGGGLFEVTFNTTANKIHRITFGSQASLTVIKKVSYNRLIFTIVPMPIITLISP